MKHSFVILFLMSTASITLLNKGKLDTLTLGKGDERLLAFTNHHNVGQTSGKDVTSNVTDVSDLVATRVVLNVGKNTNTANIVTTVGHDGATVLELDEAINLTSFQVKLDSIVLLNVRVGESDSSTIVGNNEWDLVLANSLSLNLKQFELSFLIVDTVRLETTLDIKEDSEMLTSLLERDDILETERELVGSAHSVVDLDETLLILTDLNSLLVVEGVL
eukprot:CAMPEP_0176359962 /NCGR_PEP_ID=MMETSP0126-20121128/16791_1 /TAXON_ID=141414 ORGANISM="Strombidinopsis acuminatum, Strain SPMC142" /NCGR_SAMPLE_ID=MMETSP0126 /ASSEMBLY_ACC=CAM_ASM_000229 /LENGTH=218 /DNA_ID=CAMNT_0017715081 /DNA_START=153 /DNA_END=809 /DNA_ORIENTATION=+